MDLKLVKGGIPKEVTAAAEALAVSRTTTYIAYLQRYYGEVVERIFAARVKNKKLRMTEVLRSATGNRAKPIVKNLLYSSYGGYSAVYTKKKIYGHSGGYPYLVFDEDEFDRWNDIDVLPGVCKTYVNAREFLKKSEEFKYCGYSGGDVITWLNEYRRDNSIELLGKLGLGLSPRLRRHIASDARFRRFVFENHAACDLYGVEATEYAFKHGVSVEEARRICHEKHMADHRAGLYVPALSGTGLDKIRVLDYCDKNNIPLSSYNDFLTAVKYLKLDLADTKNIYPKDFKKMHDLYTAQYKAEEDERISKGFEEAASKAKRLCLEDGDYHISVPKNLSEIVAEGEALGHCVGKLGYGKRMAEGGNYILFVRQKEHPDVPFITVEFNHKTNKILQSHGKHNSEAPPEVKAFLNKALLTRRKTNG